MIAYFDSSLVTKWYLPEADSDRALRLRARYLPPAIFTHLHRLELTTAWQARVFRRELPAATVTQALADLADDVASGVWALPAYDLVEVCFRAEALSLRRAATMGVRSLDVLHVAAALVLDATDFVTCDDRQAKLARAAGLKTVLLAEKP